MGTIGWKKARLNILASMFAIVMTLAGPVVGTAGANMWNEWTSGGSIDYTQIENTTAYLSAPFVEEKISTEARYASVNGTGTSANITAETPTWDTTTEWDQVTITSTGTDVKLIFNLNITLDELLDTKNTEMRIKTNGSKALEITIEAVKSDGVDLKTHELYNKEVANLSQKAVWDFDPTDILEASNELDPAKTDDVWIRIIIEGKGTTKLTTADVVQFQFAWGGNDNVYALSSEDALGMTAVIMGLLYLILAVLATPMLNIDGDGSVQKTFRQAARRSRGTMGYIPVIVMAIAAVVMCFLTMDAAALSPGTSATTNSVGMDPLFWGIAGSFLLIGGWAFMMFSGFTKTLPKKFNLLGFSVTTGSGILGTIIATATDTSTFVSSAFLGHLGWQGWIFAIGYGAFFFVLIWNGIWCWRKKKPFTLWR